MRPGSERRRGAAPAFLALALLAACAQTPESVAPMPVDEARYGRLPCAAMAAEMARANRELAFLSTEQSAKRVNDAVGWSRLLHPTQSAWTRDIRSYIALNKGELVALDRAMAGRCPGLRS